MAVEVMYEHAEEEDSFERYMKMLADPVALAALLKFDEAFSFNDERSLTKNCT